MPECALALLQAAIYLALAPKSNSLELAWDAVREAIRTHGELAIPNSFVNAVTRFDKKRGVGQGYRYDHDSPNGYSGQNHLPKELWGRDFWQPVERGFERDLKKRLDWFETRREPHSKGPAPELS
jgi:putative ATPase